MRQPIVIVLVVAVVLALGSAVVLFQRVRTTQAEYAALQADEQATRNRYGQAINEIAAIQDSLNAIVLGEDAATLAPSELDSERRLGSPGGDAALERIAVLKAGIERTKTRIQQLDARLREDGVRISGLRKMIANLRESVSEKETLVAVLTGRVDSLETTVTGLAADVEEKQVTIQAQEATIEVKRRELGTVYVAMGSRRELQGAGVVAAKGGVLGLGKTLEPTGHIDPASFRPVDTDAQSVIRIPATKAQVLSNQPSSSYRILPAGEQLELQIVDPERFRTVKHVVILTT